MSFSLVSFLALYKKDTLISFFHMSLPLNPSSDWDNWTPPNMSNVATAGSDADLMSVIAEAGSQQPPRRRKRRQRRNRRVNLDALSTTATAAGPTFRRKRRVIRKKRMPRRKNPDGLWLNKRVTLHSIISKLNWAKVPLVRLLRK